MWWVCVDKSSVMKKHYVRSPLRKLLIEDLSSRGKGFDLDEGKSVLEPKLHFEIGGVGILYVNQPKMSFTIFGKELTIDCISIPLWIELITSYKRREFSDGTEYIKLYSRFCCLVLSLPERESLLFQLKGKSKEAKKKADRYFAGVRGEYNKMGDGIYIRGKKNPSNKIPSIDVKELKHLSLFKVDDDNKPKE